ncbi:GntR family transcriptional regulator [Cohnella pontilimi]|uniref:GntR family transcriptional regulator n=1 Tax=Cohnella pontilimi TaxID=2564100 RepID=A0A4U0F321_9BACL|nr:GntR family transcriptional regulator [Cohnella pontilimi]TJY38926.1 GntR family transcriptional regulator [Cohnella pontilimi]
MFIEIDMQSEIPLYTQLADQLIEGIASGQLKPGDPLPSVRSLGADLGINLHTVNKAYQTLKQEGFLDIHRKQGVIVRSGGMPPITDEFLRRMGRQVKSLAAEAAIRGMNEEDFVRKCTETYRSTINFSGGDGS